MKDIPGDGNCLFRALADQLEGDMSQHMRHRREIVSFITQHRREFEPFIEDGMPFERYGQFEPLVTALLIHTIAFDSEKFG